MRQYRKRAKQGIFLNADTERVARSAVANADTNQMMVNINMLIFLNLFQNKFQNVQYLLKIQLE